MANIRRFHSAHSFPPSTHHSTHHSTRHSTQDGTLQPRRPCFKTNHKIPVWGKPPPCHTGTRPLPETQVAWYSTMVWCGGFPPSATSPDRRSQFPILLSTSHTRWHARDPPDAHHGAMPNPLGTQPWNAMDRIVNLHRSRAASPRCSGYRRQVQHEPPDPCHTTHLQPLSGARLEVSPAPS